MEAANSGRVAAMKARLLGRGVGMRVAHPGTHRASRCVLRAAPERTILPGTNRRRSRGLLGEPLRAALARPSSRRASAVLACDPSFGEGRENASTSPLAVAAFAAVRLPFQILLLFALCAAFSTKATASITRRDVFPQSNATNATQSFYDTAGRPWATLDPLNHETDHFYDDAGRPLQLRNRRAPLFQFGYAADGLASTFTYPSARQSQIVNREARGLPQTLQSPASNQTGLTYDGMGRVKTKTDAVGALVWTYDNEGNATNVAETISSTTKNTGRIFDELGRVTSVTDAAGYTVGYSYDDEGNVRTITYPGNRTVTYIYDGSNRLKTVTDWANQVTTYTYETAMRLSTVLRPNGTR